ncbi:DUF1071 domain-containing protein [Eisenbergiella tayi]|uniref:Sak single strand annealing protein n=1 Tax=Eisenbergiella tayi TaxID=1432052 RepID=UPI00307C9B89
MLKSYEELRQIDVSPYCEERDKVSYLPYNKCIDLLHKNGAETVYFLPVQNPKNGSSLYESDTVFADKSGNTNRCYETRIEIHIDDKIYYMQSPVMNGANPVKDNSMSQHRVWNSMTRSFVKAVAMYTGLGFDLWLKEEDSERKAQAQADIYHDILKVQERVFETVTAIQKKGNLSLAQIAEKMGRSEEELKQYINMYKVLYAVENNLNLLLRELG